MSRFITILTFTIMLVSAWCLSSACATNLYFPHVASDANWETEIGIINDSDSTLSGTLYAYNSSGLVSESKSISLAVNGRLSLNVGSYFTEPSQIAYLKFDGGSSSCLGYEKFYTSTCRVAIPAVSNTSSSELYIPHIASNSGWWTGLALVNTNSSSTTLTFTFNNGSQETLTLSAGQHWSNTIAGAFPNLDASALESAVISNTAGVIGLELFGSTGGSNYLSGVLLGNQTATTLYYPHIASDSRWWSGLVAYNPSTNAANLTLYPYDASGNALESSSISVAAKGKYIGTAAGLDLPMGTAWFKLHSSTPINGFELFGTYDGKQLAGYSTVNINTNHGCFVKLEDQGWTGIALVNTGTSAAEVVLTALNDSGSQIATTVLTVAANGKVVNLPEKLFTESISNASYIKFSTTSAVVGFQLNASSDDMLIDGLPGLPITGSSIDDLAGTWSITETSGSNTCGEQTGVIDTYQVTVAQNGNALTVSTPAGIFNGSINDNTLSWTGSYPNEGGTTTITSMTLTVSPTSNSFSGSSSWSWTDGSSSCSGNTISSGVKSNNKTVFQEDFSGDLSQWNIAGSPTPSIVSTEGNPAPAFSTNDDLNYGGWAISKSTFDYSNGLTMSVDTKPGHASFPDQRFSLVELNQGNALYMDGSSIRCDKPIIKVMLTADDYGTTPGWGEKTPGPWISFYVYDEAGNILEEKKEIAISSGSGWHNIKAEIQSDLTVQFYLDNTLLYTTQKSIPASFSGSAAIGLGDRLSYYDNVKVIGNNQNANARSYKNFKITANKYAMTAGASDAGCKSEFGDSYALADWTDIETLYDVEGSLTNFFSGLKIVAPGAVGDSSYNISYNGQEFYSSDRHYFISRHDHNKPSYYLAHDNINNYELSLGSWSGDRPALCITSNTTTIAGQATLGPLSGSEITLMDLNESIIGTYTSKTSDSDLNNAGAFSFTIESSKIPATFLLVASGGKDIDPLDDGAMGSSIDNNGSLHAILTTDYIKAQGLKINPLTEIIYQDALNTYGDTLASISITNLTSYLDSEAKKYLTDANATYTDILAFTPREDKLKSKIPWDKILSLVVSGIHSGEISENINQRVESVKGWLKDEGIYTDENNTSIEQLSDDADGNRIITSITKSEDNTLVSTLKQIFTTKNGEIINVYVSKVNDTESYVRASVEKSGHAFSIEGKTTLLQGLAFDTNTIATFINSLISVSDLNSSTVNITIAKELTTRLSDGEVLFKIDGRKPTNEELKITNNDPVVEWLINSTNKIFNTIVNEKFSINGKNYNLIFNNGVLILEIDTTYYNNMLGIINFTPDKIAENLGKTTLVLLGVTSDDLFKNATGELVKKLGVKLGVKTAGKLIAHGLGALSLALDAKFILDGGISKSAIKLGARHTMTFLYGKNNKIYSNQEIYPVIYISPIATNEDIRKVILNIQEIQNNYISQNYNPNYNPTNTFLFKSGQNKPKIICKIPIKIGKSYIVFPNPFVYQKQFNDYEYKGIDLMNHTVRSYLNVVSKLSHGGGLNVPNAYDLYTGDTPYTNFTYTYSNNPDELALNASSSIAPSGETITNYSWLNALGQEIKNGKNVIMTPDDATLMMITKDHTATITLKTTSSSGKIGKKTEIITGLSTSFSGSSSTTYSWSPGSWGICSGACGTNNATQTRTVQCKSSSGSIVSDSYCSSIKPATTQSCTASQCPSISYAWQTGSWGTCSGACGTNNATQTRTVQCKSSDGSVVAESYCSGVKPSVTQSCTDSQCPNESFDFEDFLTFGHTEGYWKSVSDSTNSTILVLRVHDIGYNSRNYLSSDIAMVGLPGAGGLKLQITPINNDKFHWQYIDTFDNSIVIDQECTVLNSSSYKCEDNYTFYKSSSSEYLGVLSAN